MTGIYEFHSVREVHCESQKGCKEKRGGNALLVSVDSPCPIGFKGIKGVVLNLTGNRV
jgi:hypothetical protein